MKRLIANDYITTSIGFPPVGETWDFLQDAYTEAVKSLAEARIAGMPVATTYPYILYGCEYVESGGNYTVSAGAIYYNGLIYIVDVVGTTALPVGPDVVIAKTVTTFDAVDPIEYTDAVTYNVHQINKIEIGTGTSGTSGYITAFADVATVPNNSTETGLFAYDRTFVMNKNYKGEVDTSAGGSAIVLDVTNAAIGSEIFLKGTFGSGAGLQVTVGSGVTCTVILAATGALSSFTAASNVVTGVFGSGTDASIEATYVGKNGGANHQIYIVVYAV